MITKLFHSHFLNMNRSSLPTRSFRYRLSENGFAGPKSFRVSLSLEPRSPTAKQSERSRHARRMFSVKKEKSSSCLGHCGKMDRDESSSLMQEHMAYNNPQLDDGNPDLSFPNARKCKVYKRRWYILFVFTLTSIVSNFMWNTWGPIQRPCRVVFGWETWTVLLLSSLGAIGPILGFIPSTWLMDTKGLRTSVFVTSLMLVAGKAIQVIPFNDTTVKTVFIYIGHLVTMLPSFIANGAPPLVSSTWFPPNERTTATAIGTLAANFGAALAFFIGPSMIPKTFDNSGNNNLNLTDNEIRLIEVRLRDYFYLQTGLAALLFMCVAVYFPSKPPLPPSIAASTRKVTEIGYVEGLKLLIRNQSYWLLVFVLAASFGIYFGWTSVLDLAVQPFNISGKTSGLLGTGGSLAGIISGIIIARSADVVKRWTKQILVGLFTGTVVCQLLFTMTCSRILPFSQGLLFASIICSGLLFNGTIPLVFELIMECVFPVGEGTSVGMGLVLANSVIFMFDAAFMFPSSDVQWMNWVSVGGIAFCIPLLLVYKSQYRRLDLDAEPIKEI